MCMAMQVICNLGIIVRSKRQSMTTLSMHSQPAIVSCLAVNGGFHFNAKYLACSAGA